MREAEGVAVMGVVMVAVAKVAAAGGIGRMRHGNSFVRRSKNSSCYRTKDEHRCTVHMCRPRWRSSEWPRWCRCISCCRRSW